MSSGIFGGRSGPPSDDYLEGQMLIAMPQMGDLRFQRTLIYLCAHGEQGAMGLVVNKRALQITFPELLSQFSIKIPPEAGRLSDGLDTYPILLGGPVEPGRGFVLHSRDYFSDEATLPIGDRVGLTSTLDILRAIARGDGPSRSLVALGYSGWAPGQLEMEMRANGWLHCPADDELIFGTDLDTKYDRALTTLGIDLSLLSGEAGHA